MTVLPDIKEEDMAMMLYTAGTTGKPKGVMITHSNLHAQALASFDSAELATRTVPRVAVSAMPMAHVYGVAVMMGGYVTPKHLVNGYSVQLAWFEPEKFMQRIVQHQCNMMAVVPTMLIYLLNHPRLDDYDLSCIIEVVSSAAPLPYKVAKAFSERFDCKICEAYGQTESTGMITANRLSRPYKPGSCGQAYFNVEIRIVDENDRPLSTGETGEITVRGPTVMKGYFNRPEETAEVIRNGWLHTGDMGYLDEDGYLFIVDRKKDLIIKGGENIFPAELEEHLYTIDGIAEAAVVGILDSVYGENVAAYVVLKPGVELTSQDIISQMKTKISPFKLPHKINFIDELPKSPVGKILRRVLRDRARANNV
jgi:long-chain acyl-CoA synthetase